MAKKYYFGYSLNQLGAARPMKWFEEDGVPVGGKFEIVQKWEIKENEFKHRKLDNLSRKLVFNPLPELH